MPATYAPGPRCNTVDYTTGFWACQALNTRYLASTCLDPQHVGGLPVDNPWDELGTGWVETGGKQAKPDLLDRVEKGQVEGLSGTLWATFAAANFPANFRNSAKRSPTPSLYS